MELNAATFHKFEVAGIQLTPNLHVSRNYQVFHSRSRNSALDLSAKTP
jgi:hypothetical protein